MGLGNIILIAVGIIVILIILRFVTQILAKIIAVVLVLAAIFYFLFMFNGGLVSLGEDNFMLYEFQEKYCEEQFDTVKCNCLITPLIEELESSYTPEEIDELKKNKLKSAKVIKELIEARKSEIMLCLEENDTGLSMEDLLKEMKSLEIKDKVKSIMEKKE